LNMSSLIQSGKSLSEMTHFSGFKKLPVCDYDLSLYRVCIQTSYCRCVVPHIAQKKTAYPFEPYLGLNMTTYPTPDFYSNISNSSIKEKLRLLPLSLSLTTLGAYTIDSRAIKDLNIHSWQGGTYKLQLNFRQCYTGVDHSNCFIAGTFTLAIGMNISVPINKADYIMSDWMTQSIPNITDTKNPSAAIYLPFYPHDMGACPFQFSEYQLDGNKGSNNPSKKFPEKSQILAMVGAYNTNCYIPEKDISVAPFSLKTNHLEKFWYDITKIIPASQRPYFAFFSGSIWGTGMYQRSRISRNTLFPRTWTPYNNGTILQKTVVAFPGSSSDDDYMHTLGHSRFCLMVRGITGWSFRLCDAVYAGCIPVFSIDMLHNFYSDILDYTKFAVFIEEREIDSIEKHLMTFSDEKVNQMQMRLLKVRNAFIYDYKNEAVDFDTRDDAFAYNYISIALKREKIFFE